MSQPDVRELLQRAITPALYQRIADEWKAHSIAEDNHDIDGLLATLTPDCVYEVPQMGLAWRGHAGAADFYRELLSAFPDIKFALRNIVIGPQGVYEEATLSGTHQHPWLEVAPTLERVAWSVVIYFPWDLEREKFQGERVFVDTGAPLFAGGRRTRT